MPLNRLIDMLESQGTRYVRITHSKAYTAQEIAAALHIKGMNMAKAVIVKLDGKLAMVVVPAPLVVSLERLQEITGAKNVRLATELDFKDRFPECEVGAMPPFGNLYGMETFVAQELAEDEMIAFNACSHTEVIQMAYSDYEKLVEPKVINCCVHAFS